MAGEAAGAAGVAGVRKDMSAVANADDHSSGRYASPPHTVATARRAPD